MGAGGHRRAKNGEGLARHRSRPRNCAGRAFAEDDHAEHLVLGHVLDPARSDDLAVLHHRDPVGEVEHVMDVVADEENADALRLELLDELADLRRLRPARARRSARP